MEQRNINHKKFFSEKKRKILVIVTGIILIASLTALALTIKYGSLDIFNEYFHLKKTTQKTGNSDILSDKELDKIIEEIKSDKKYNYNQGNNLSDEEVRKIIEEIRSNKRYNYNQGDNLSDEELKKIIEEIKSSNKYNY